MSPHEVAVIPQMSINLQNLNRTYAGCSDWQKSVIYDHTAALNEPTLKPTQTVYALKEESP